MDRGRDGERVEAGRRVPRLVWPTLLLALLILALCTGLALAAAGGPQTPRASSSRRGRNALVGPAPAPKGVEIRSERTATSDTYLLPNGAREARIYQAPVNYKDAQGDWRPIEEELEPAPQGAGLTNGANSFDLSLPDRLGSGAVRLSIGDGWVSERLLGEGSEAAVAEGDTAIYEGSSSGTTFELASIPTGVEETIELADDSQPSTFRYEIDASRGVAPTLEKDGSVVFRHPDGSVVARMPAPTVTDGAAGAVPDSQVAHYGLTSLPDGNMALELTVDRGWLEASGRVWPVTVDPTIETKRTGSVDCQISVEPSGEESEPVCASQFLTGLSAYYGTKAGAVHRARVALRFGMEPALTDAYIASASVNLYAGETKEAETVDLMPITEKWETPNWYNYWDYFFTKKKWQTPGGDFSGEGSELSTSERGTAAGWWHFTKGLGPIVRTWNMETYQAEREHKLAINTGVMVKIADETPCESTCGEFFSLPCAYSCGHGRAYGFSTYGEHAPYLGINYYPPAPKGSRLSSPTEGTTTARRLRLAAKWSAAGVTGISFQFRDPGGSDPSFKEIPSGLVTNQAGEPVSFPIPLSGVNEAGPFYFDAADADPTLKSSGGRIQVRALFEGSVGAAGYSESVEATVDRRIGGPKDATAQIGPGTVDLLTGNFNVKRTDVSIGVNGAEFGFTRSFNSRDATTTTKGEIAFLGPGWKPSFQMEETALGSWRSLEVVSKKEEWQGQTLEYNYATITSSVGRPFSFKKEGSNYVAPPESPGWSLVEEAGGARYALMGPDGVRTTFERQSGSELFLPSSITKPGPGSNPSSFVYQTVGEQRRLRMIIAPSPPWVSCTGANAESTEGCRAMVFNYATETYGVRLKSITYFAKGLGTGSEPVAEYAYNSAGQLVAEWDPRYSPALKEEYAYNSAGQISTLKPAGLAAWTFGYKAIGEEGGPGRLISLSRASLVSGSPVAQTTIAYGVPISGAGAPYPMGGSSVREWGQEQTPTDATAVFPPGEVPASPPTAYNRATVYYMDVEGRVVNTATPAGAGTSQPSINMTETNQSGGVIRALTADNRLTALAAGGESAARAAELETKRDFSADGTQMEEEWGPTHAVKLPNGTVVAKAREHKTVVYDEGEPELAAGEVAAHLPTRVTVGVMTGEPTDADIRESEIKYDWALRKPSEVITDPQGLDLRTQTIYNDTTGQAVETRQPSDPGGGEAGSSKTIYYTAPGEGPTVCQSKIYLGLPCETMPAGQQSGTGRPELLVKRMLEYNSLGEVTNEVEAAGMAALEAGTGVRRAISTYDPAGRLRTLHYIGGGTAVPEVEYEYDPNTGLQIGSHFVCEGGCSPEATRQEFDELGRPIRYEDATGNVAHTTYDLEGRVASVEDSKGSVSYGYDPNSGLLTSVSDSQAGAFTAKYDADGNLISESLPNGLTQTVRYNATDEAVGLEYTKEEACGSSCTWFKESVSPSVYGQVMSMESTLVSHGYSYDKAGRLLRDQETPAGGGCTVREYGWDSDSNRTSVSVAGPPVGGGCAVSGGEVESFQYDKADRLMGAGIVYDEFGRITSLPAADAGGSTLTTSYYSDNMIAEQSQGEITDAYGLDSALRPRQRIENSGLKGTEEIHYDAPGGSPAWTEFGGKTSRPVVGIDGELTAQFEGAGIGTFLLHDLRGNVVATAAASKGATSLLATYRTDAFGAPLTGSAPRYGWQGGRRVRTEFPSGVAQAGVRSYVPKVGRFISPDPEPGGSANAYDYANGDPINGSDPTGMGPMAKQGGQNSIGNARAVSAKATTTMSILPPVFIPSPIQPVAEAVKTIAERVQEVWNSLKGFVSEKIEEIEEVAAPGAAAYALGTVFEMTLRYALNRVEGGARALNDLRNWVKQKYTENLVELLRCAQEAWNTFFEKEGPLTLKAGAAAWACREAYRAAEEGGDDVPVE